MRLVVQAHDLSTAVSIVPSPIPVEIQLKMESFLLIYLFRNTDLPPPKREASSLTRKFQYGEFTQIDGRGFRLYSASCFEVRLNIFTIRRDATSV